MSYQEDRTRRINIFEDTMRWCEGNRRLLEAIVRTREHTILYKNPLKDCRLVENRYAKPCRVFVSQRRTLETAQRLHMEYPKGRIGVLNFASAVNPGGDVMRGSNAQEECLCRCSTLYPCLNTEELYRDYYSGNRKSDDMLYTDSCIYTPEILKVKTDTRWPERMVESDWFLMDVISCAAPNLREQPLGEQELITEEDLAQLLYFRIKGIFQVAVENRIDAMVLGAFGCGAFCNSPRMVVWAFKKALKEYRYFFRAVEFAVYCSPQDMANYEIFFSSLKDLF